MTVILETSDKRKFVSAIRRVERHLLPGLPPLLWLTDPARTPGLECILPALPRGSGVVYRHFGEAVRMETARTLAKLCRLHGLYLLVSNDPELAELVHASGVHWPFRSRQRAKYWRTRFSIMTASAHSRSDLANLNPNVFDAAIFSTVFPSESPTACQPVTPIRFRKIAGQSPLPCYGLGGVTAHNVSKIADFAGLAAVSGIQDTFGKSCRSRI